ncbi:MAG TPA: alpha-1,2-fucosyltransferase [Microbacteriaceae bacterium]|nr:alpha-1,2-fucosyltransferase [Microbacteriaceae bacterium]
MTADIRDGITAYLQGGIGNQLFILAAAWAQARRLDVPLYIDASRFIAPDPLERPETRHPFTLQRYTLPGVVLEETSPWYRNSPRRPVPIRVPGRGSWRLPVHRYTGLGYDERIEQVRPGTTLLGYFQSPRYFERVADDMADMMTGVLPSASESPILARIDEDPRATLHVRRGDYLDAATRRHHGLAEPQYFERSVELLQALGRWTGGRVYSDSPDIVTDELSTIPDLEFVRDSRALDEPTTLLAMSTGTAFVMSNSSFSWWAAWLMSRRTDAPVIAPRPWVASGAAAADLLDPAWITLGASA